MKRLPCSAYFDAAASGTKLIDHEVDEAPDTGLQKTSGRIDRHDLYIPAIELGQYLQEATGSQVLCHQKVR